jgi:hypothetical protein
MALNYVLDEHLRRVLWPALQQHNANGVDVLDVVRVGDPADLPLGTQDPDLLVWAEREGRVIVTNDRRTMPGHLAAHLTAGRHSPGVIILRPGHTIPAIVAELVLVAHVCDPAELLDQIRYLP